MLPRGAGSGCSPGSQHRGLRPPPLLPIGLAPGLGSFRPAPLALRWGAACFKCRPAAANIRTHARGVEPITGLPLVVTCPALSAAADAADAAGEWIEGHGLGLASGHCGEPGSTPGPTPEAEIDLEHRPAPYWRPDPHGCGSANRGCDSLCMDCTRRPGTAALLDGGTCVCLTCGCLFRWECPSARTARCGIRRNPPGVVRADPVVHRDLALRALARLAWSLVSAAKHSLRISHALRPTALAPPSGSSGSSASPLRSALTSTGPSWPSSLASHPAA